MITHEYGMNTHAGICTCYIVYAKHTHIHEHVSIDTEREHMKKRTTEKEKKV